MAKRFTGEEIELLKCSEFPNSVLAKILKRSIRSIRAKRDSVLPRSNTPYNYTTLDIRLISDVNIPAKDVGEMLGRSTNAIFSMRSILRKSGYEMTKRKRDLILEEYRSNNNIPIKRLAIKYEVTERYLLVLFRKHRLSKRVWRKYSKEDISFIKNNYLEMSYTEIAKFLSRSPASVKMKIKQMMDDGELKKKYVKREYLLQESDLSER